MRVLFTNATTVKGGAARASIRNYNALKRAGLNVQFATNQKSKTQSEYTLFRHSWLKQKYHQLISRIERKAIRKYVKDGFGYWSLSKWNRYNVQSGLNSHDVDLIHLNWINDNFLSIGEIEKINKPVVWTFHDMWAFTGGCHYSGSCNGYISGCKTCPAVIESTSKNLTKHAYNSKEKAYSGLNLTVLCPSSWMAEKAKESGMFNSNVAIHVIPNCVDTNIYKPQKQDVLVDELKLTSGKMRILFGAINSLSDERKGGKYLIEVLKRIESSFPTLVDEIELLVFGTEKSEQLKQLPFNVTFLGYVRDEDLLAKIYGVADLFLVTSQEDNLPNTILESLACSTPVVAFNIGGIKDMIRHQENGYLAIPFDVEDYVNGVVSLLKHKHIQEIRTVCRETVLDHFSVEVVASQHIDLYTEILSDK